MRGDKNSIDFILADSGNESEISRMHIDETGNKGGIGSDHSWIELNTTATHKPKRRNNKTKYWNTGIPEKWMEYLQKKNQKLQDWEKQADNGGSEDVAQCYKNWVNIVKSTMTKEVGVKKTTTETDSASE